MVEEADLQAAKELFGEDLDLDKMQPKSAKDFEDLARALAAKYLQPHGRRCRPAWVGLQGLCCMEGPGARSGRQAAAFVRLQVLPHGTGCWSW